LRDGTSSAFGRWKQEHGEIVYGTSGHYGVADAVTAWESEKKYYKGGRSILLIGMIQALHSGCMKDTQLVGCAKVECNGRIIWYATMVPGNVLGQKHINNQLTLHFF